MISADDLKNAQSEISDEELEGAAGGTKTIFMFPISITWCGGVDGRSGCV